MPAIDHAVPDMSSKAMNTRMSRSAMTWSVKRANYMRFVLPKLERLICGLNDTYHAIKTGNDYKAQAAIASALLHAMDQERQLLGFPSPGKRRDEGQADGLKAAQSPAVVDVMQVQAATATAGQGATVETAQPASEPMPSGSQDS